MGVVMGPDELKRPHDAPYSNVHTVASPRKPAAGHTGSKIRVSHLSEPPKVDGGHGPRHKHPRGGHRVLDWTEGRRRRCRRRRRVRRHPIRPPPLGGAAECRGALPRFVQQRPQNRTLLLTILLPPPRRRRPPARGRGLGRLTAALQPGQQRALIPLLLLHQAPPPRLLGLRRAVHPGQPRAVHRRAAARRRRPVCGAANDREASAGLWHRRQARLAFEDLQQQRRKALSESEKDRVQPHAGSCLEAGDDFQPGPATPGAPPSPAARAAA
jgi:hypothetical protein